MRAALLLALLGACEDPVGPPNFDAGRRVDAGRESDAGSPDAAASDGGDDAGGRPDASLDAGTDAGRGDAGRMNDAGLDAGTDSGAAVFDAGPRSDAGRSDSGAIDYCSMVSAGTPCGVGGTCPAGRVCLDNGCGAMRCFPAGRSCSTAGDCPAGSGCVNDVCARASGCGDSRDCPAGFSCDAGACVDRRIFCDRAELGTGCPRGFLCDSTGAEGAPFCIRSYTRCASAAACPFFGQCRDVALNGVPICHWSGGPMCQDNGDCPAAGEVCGVDPENVDAFCGPAGPCAAGADCGPGYECIDTWGDGVSECAPTGGTCRRQQDCPSPAICASPYFGGPPRCVLHPF